MRTLRSLLAATALALGAAACDSGRVLVPEQMVGVWTDSIPQEQGITWAHTLSLGADGRFSWDQVTYGVPPYGADVPVYRTVTHGRYRVHPGALDMRVESVEFSGVGHGNTTTREIVEHPQWSGDRFALRFTGDDLELTYTTAPFDAPIETRLTFTRQRLGPPID